MAMKGYESKTFEDTELGSKNVNSEKSIAESTGKKTTKKTNAEVLLETDILGEDVPMLDLNQSSVDMSIFQDKKSRTYNKVFSIQTPQKMVKD